MVILTEVAEKLQAILNDNDSEIGDDNPAGFEFSVATQGFHLDHVQNRVSGSNFIPVFIGSLGGRYNPIAGLKQADMNVQVTLYFPVRFKDEFYKLNDYLVDTFVGRTLNWGTNSGRCVSNISPAQYGEIQNLDTKQFATWVADTYQESIDVMEPWMSMTFTLYLSTIGNGYVYGNEAECLITATIDEKCLYINSKYYIFTPFASVGGKYAYTKEDGSAVFYLDEAEPGVADPYYVYDGTTFTQAGTLSAANISNSTSVSDGDPTFQMESIQSTTNPSVEQILGSGVPETKGLPTNTSYGASFALYYKKTMFYRVLMDRWARGLSQRMRFSITLGIPGEFEYTRTCYLQSNMVNLQKGEPLTFTLAFSKEI